MASLTGWHMTCSTNLDPPMRSSDILLVLSALASSGFSCTTRTSEATEIPAGPQRSGAETSCRHDLGRCGGHKPGDGTCGGVASDTSKADLASPTPLDDVIVEPGKFAEINFEMAEGSAADVAFEAAGGSLQWNVHSHDGDKVVIHVEGTASEGTVRFAAPGAGPYSYLWQNSGSAPVRLTARLTARGTVRVHSVHPAP